MALTSGFFNSVSGDRKYSAEQMSMIFDGLITDGVYSSIGDKFAVTPDTGMTVKIGTGRAWFNHTWVYNDSPLQMTFDLPSPSTLGRNDLIVLKIDHSTAIRSCEFQKIVGTPAVTPTDPSVPENDETNGVYYYKFARVAIPANASAITESMITNYVGVTGQVQFITGLMRVQNLSMIYSQLDGEFREWWNNVIKPVLDEETATLLANRINDIDVDLAPLKTYKWLKKRPSNMKIDSNTFTDMYDVALVRKYTDDDVYYYAYSSSSAMHIETPSSGDDRTPTLRFDAYNTLTVRSTTEVATVQNTLRGKWLVVRSNWETQTPANIAAAGFTNPGIIDTNYGLVFVPEDAVVSSWHTINGSGFCNVNHCKFYPVVSNMNEAAIVTSANRNAYPDSGEQDGFTYTYIGSNMDALANSSRVAVVSGTVIPTLYGNTSAARINKMLVSVDVGFIPKFVMSIGGGSPDISGNDRTYLYMGDILENNHLGNIGSNPGMYTDRELTGYDAKVASGTTIYVPVRNIGESNNKYTIVCIG